MKIRKKIKKKAAFTAQLYPIALSAQEQNHFLVTLANSPLFQYKVGFVKRLTSCFRGLAKYGYSLDYTSTTKSKLATNTSVFKLDTLPFTLEPACNALVSLRTFRPLACTCLSSKSEG